MERDWSNENWLSNFYILLIYFLFLFSIQFTALIHPLSNMQPTTELRTSTCSPWRRCWNMRAIPDTSLLALHTQSASYTMTQHSGLDQTSHAKVKKNNLKTNPISTLEKNLHSYISISSKFLNLFFVRPSLNLWCLVFRKRVAHIATLSDMGSKDHDSKQKDIINIEFDQQFYHKNLGLNLQV